MRYGHPPDEAFPLRKLELFENTYPVFEADPRLASLLPTPLLAAKTIGNSLGLPNLYLKCEGALPSGSHKDRAAYYLVQAALNQGAEGICVATCGNFGVAIARAAHNAALPCVVFLSNPTLNKSAETITQFGATIVPVTASYEEAIALAGVYASTHHYFDANPGGPFTHEHLLGYEHISREIFFALGTSPSWIACPTSNGTTVAGVYRAWKRMLDAGTVDRMPRILAGTTVGQNPILEAWQDARLRCRPLRPSDIVETKINAPLVNWDSLDGDLALDAIRASNGRVEGVTDAQLLEAAALLRAEGVHSTPAGAAGLAALLATPPSDRVRGVCVVVVTAIERTPGTHHA